MTLDVIVDLTASSLKQLDVTTRRLKTCFLDPESRLCKDA